LIAFVSAAERRAVLSSLRKAAPVIISAVARPTSARILRGSIPNARRSRPDSRSDARLLRALKGEAVVILEASDSGQAMRQIEQNPDVELVLLD
jgi:hypothetical protein